MLYDKFGSAAWVINKVKEIVDANEIYQATQSNDALLNVAAKIAELAAIGIPLWFADSLLTKTGLDRVFDSLKTNKSFEQYLRDQAAAKNLRDLGLGSLAEWGLHELTDWVTKSGALDPFFEGVNDLFTDSKRIVYKIMYYDPLALDLDGDGIETVGVNGQQSVYFDDNGDGVKSASGWVKADDGMLVLDRNGNGVVDNGGELFGDQTLLANGSRAANGMAALASIDSNLDGKVDLNDAQFANLRVWRDLNQDGVSQSAELFTLDQLGINALNTAASPANISLGNGNSITHSGTFSKADGSTGNMVDVDLDANPFYRTFTDSVAVPPALAGLPDVRGAGLLRDLREAA